jgi:uncharacterized protein YfaS (alpha-2-macroglobulin family)
MTLEFIYQDSTVRLKATWKDFANEAATPASQTLSVFDPHGRYVVSGITNPTLESTGVYYYDYDMDATAPVGTYTAWWKATIASLDEVVRGQFEVEGL